MNIPKSQSVLIPLTIFRGALLNLAARAGFIALIHPLMQQIGLYLKRRFTGKLAKDLWRTVRSENELWKDDFAENQLK
jgi:hypothetical protein